MPLLETEGAKSFHYQTEFCTFYFFLDIISETDVSENQKA